MGTSWERRSPGPVSRTAAAITSLWPSRKTVASTGIVSPATARAGQRPQSTWGRMPSMTMRPIMPCTLPPGDKG
jgi:hypothetical protein